MKRILCYGDSNMWGHVPAKGTRYPEDTRWPCVMGTLLGPEYTVLEDSISGRTTLFEDPFAPCRCGRENLGYALLANAPIDLLILALGTNDLKYTNAAGTARGLARMIELIRNADAVYSSYSPIFSTPQMPILLVAPPLIDERIAVLRPEHTLAGAAAESRALPGLLAQLAREKGTAFIDLSVLAQPSIADCLHLTAEGHRTVGRAMAEKVRTLL